MNPTQVELEAALRAVAMYPDYPPSYKRFVFIFAGHGLNEQIVVKDGFVRITENVIVPLEAKNACSLATVPKLFFIDACRGPLQDNGVIVASRGGEVVESIKVPEKGNMLIAYSTLPHYEALEDSSSGGLWLKTLASELRNSNDSITDVLTTVRKKVLYQCMHLRTKDGAPIHQVSQSDDTLFEKVCFLTEAESREEGEAMDTSDTRAVAASGGVVVPLSLFNGHSSVSPASSTLRQGQSVRGPATTQLLSILNANKLKLDERYVEDAATGVTRYKCELKCLYGRGESGYHPTREGSMEEAAQKLLPTVRSLSSRGGAAEQVSAVMQLQDRCKKEQKEVKYDTRRTPNKRYLSRVFVSGVGRMEGKEEASEERAKESAASEALKKLKLA
eukprot:Em0022g860a